MPDFFDDGHLLQRERALKVLAAVQAAAENEMAFEQRAAVVENLEDFVLCHRWSFKFRASSFKFIRRCRSFSQTVFNHVRICTFPPPKSFPGSCF